MVLVFSSRRVWLILMILKFGLTMAAIQNAQPRYSLELAEDVCLDWIHIIRC